MSRKEKFSRTSSRSRERAKLQQQEDTQNLPPRSERFPSSRNTLARWYYNLLFVLFAALVVFLFWYGKRYSN